MMMMIMMLTSVFTRCDTACPAQPGLEPLATVGRNWIIKIIIITITKDDSDEDDDGNGEVDGWWLIPRTGVVTNIANLRSTSNSSTIFVTLYIKN